jgi:transposase
MISQFFPEVSKSNGGRYEMGKEQSRFIGIDLHTNRFNCCILNEEGKQQKTTYDITPESIKAFCETLDKNSHIMFEASTNSFEFFDRIKDKAGTIIIGNTFKLKLISFVDKKTDKIDAEKLAKYLKMQIVGGEQLMESVYVPERNIRNLRSLFATYGHMNKQLISTKNRIHSILKQNMTPLSPGVISLKSISERIKTIDMPDIMREQIEILLDTHDFIKLQQKRIVQNIHCAGAEYAKTIDILTSMTGVSVLSALAIIADVADIARFPNSKKFAAYLRSVPGIDSSNKTTIMKRTSKFGRKLSLGFLTQSYNHFKNGHPNLNAWALKKEDYKRKGLVRMAVMRKVITQIYQMLKKKEYHYFRNEKLHLQKMNDYYRILEKNRVKIGLVA